MEKLRVKRMKKLRKLRDLLERFGGVETGGDAPVAEAPPVAVKEIFRRFWPHTQPYRRWLPLIVVLVVLDPVIEAATIWLFKILVDGVLVPKSFELLPWIVLGYLGLTLGGGLIAFFDKYLSSWIGEGFLLSLRRDFFEHLHGLSMDFFERRKLGDIVSRLSNDLASIENLVLSGVTSALSYVAQLLVFVGMLFYLQWKLALVSLFVVPLFYLIARYFSRRIKHASREARRRSGSISAVAEESLSNAALVQAYNRQGDEVERFHRENRGRFAAKMASTRLSAAFLPLVDLIELVGMLAVIIVGTWLLVRGELTLGGLLAFVALISQLYRPVKGISGLINTLYAASASAERVIEYLDEKPAVQERPGAYPIGRASGKVEFNDVSFVYPKTTKEALSGVSFTAKPGETLALAGPSGAGKSTVARLLVRFYDPEAGSIRLDGHGIPDLTLDSLRENIAVLFQETLIFDGTVRENIAYGRPHATEEEIVSAARAADAHEFIETLPYGYDTVVGQKGRRISGGQRQRLAIARAMVRDAPVLILDEPTTGLDAESEQRVMEPIRRLLEGRTTVVISHNLSTAREADRILFLEDGRITESGTHAELLASGGTHAELLASGGGYARLYQMRQDDKEPLIK